MEYLLVLASLGSDGGLAFDVQETNLTLSQCEALLTRSDQSCEPDTSDSTLVFHEITNEVLLLPRCRLETNITDNCSWDNHGFYVIDGVPFRLE